MVRSTASFRSDGQADSTESSRPALTALVHSDELVTCVATTKIPKQDFAKYSGNTPSIHRSLRHSCRIFCEFLAVLVFVLAG